jgi:hypothetical protein
MGMGGAYVAHATDSSAIWYNPAGLDRSGYSDLTIEYGDFLTSTDSSDFNNECIQNFNCPLTDTEAGIKYFGYSNGSGFGVALFKPFELTTSIDNRDPDDISNDPSDTNFKSVETAYYELKIAGSHNLWSSDESGDNISWGWGLDVFYQSLDCDSCVDSFGEEAETEDVVGFGASVGLLGKWMFFEETQFPLNLKLGLNYRSASITSDDDLYEIAGDISTLPSRPESLSYGFSSGVPFNIVAMPFYVAISYHIESSTFDQGNEDSFEFSYEEDKTALGLELTTSAFESVDIYLRLGMSETDIEGINVSAYSPGYETTSFGLGARLGNWIVDFAAETRSMDYNQDFAERNRFNIDEDEDLTSFSISYSL